eukprot:g11959.t1
MCHRHGVEAAYVFVGSVYWEWPDYYRLGTLPYQGGIETLAGLLAGTSDQGVSVPVCADGETSVDGSCGPSTATYALAYLNDERNDLSYWERAADLAKAVQSVYSAAVAEGREDSSIRGIIMDQEPDESFLYPTLLRMLCLMKDEMASLAETLGTDRAQLGSFIKPLWTTAPLQLSGYADLAGREEFVGWNDGEGTMAEAVIRICDKAPVMAYSDTDTLVMSIANRALTAARAAGNGTLDTDVSL